MTRITQKLKGRRVLKISRVKNRTYVGDSRRVKTHEEYAVMINDETVAHIIDGNGKTWVIVEGHTDNKFGLVVSPMNLRLIKQLGKWAQEKWATDEQSQNRKR